MFLIASVSVFELCFYFKKVDFLESQTAHFDFCYAISFVKLTSFLFALSVFFLYFKQ